MPSSLRASRANESFARLFKGGGVQRQSLWPRSAERGTLLCSYKRRRGSKGEPSPGVPPFSFGFCVCADTLGGGRYLAMPFDPISLVLAQRNGVEPPKKSALKPPRHLGGPARLSHLGVSPNGTNWCVKLAYARWVNWPGKVSLTQSAWMLGLRVRGRGGRDQPATVAAPKSAFLWGSTPFLCARAKKWGGTGSRGNKLLPKETAHT